MHKHDEMVTGLGKSLTQPPGRSRDIVPVVANRHDDRLGVASKSQLFAHQTIDRGPHPPPARTRIDRRTDSSRGQLTGHETSCFQSARDRAVNRVADCVVDLLWAPTANEPGGAECAVRHARVRPSD